MIINLDSTTRIRSDEHCWRLEREHISKGGTRWKGLGYYATFGGAVQGAFKREIRTNHAEGVAECLAACEQTLAKYETVMDGLMMPATDFLDKIERDGRNAS